MADDFEMEEMLESMLEAPYRKDVSVPVLPFPPSSTLCYHSRQRIHRFALGSSIVGERRIKEWWLMMMMMIWCGRSASKGGTEVHFPLLLPTHRHFRPVFLRMQCNNNYCVRRLYCCVYLSLSLSLCRTNHPTYALLQWYQRTPPQSTYIDWSIFK